MFDRLKRGWAKVNKPAATASILALTLGGFVGGIVFWGGFNTAMEATNTMGFCTTCHEMRDNVYAEYRHTIHYQNRTGVQATCSDCHVPDPWVYKMIRKVQASNEVYHWLMGSIDTKEKFDAKRLHLAQNVWRSMKATDSRECRNCHTLEPMNPEFQRPRARKVHLDAFESGNTCIDCHKGIAHKSVRDQVPEAELEKLEAPKPEFARFIPKTYLDGLKRVTEKEAAAAQKAEADKAAAEAAIKARIDSAVAAALAKAPAASATTVAAAPVAGGAATSGIDWSGVTARTVNLFFPGQASFEWVQTGRDHGGARSFLKGGDQCSTCHAKETKDIGTKILAGDHKAEPEPIKGKRPHIDVSVKAVQDGTNLYLRAEWADAPHVAVPGVEGGKMDPKNASKFAMMVAGGGIERVDQAGCWATCHTDSRSMPDAKKVDATKIGALIQDEAMKEGLTKYLAESRTAMDLKGDNGPRGGGDKVKSADELSAMLKAGTFMDLVRVNSGGGAENGHVAGQRTMSGGAEVKGTVRLEGGQWIAEFSRPLKSDKPGDVSIEAGKVYTVGFAVHDDHSNARFHHVSLDLRLALDNPDAEINVTKK
jgi:nitrate/TMAO reductase-like tetraheme cytochrome c subunit